MKAITKIHHVELSVNEMPATCIDGWNRYWSEYSDDKDFVNEHYETDITKVRFTKIIAMSTSEIRAWFLDKDDIAEGKNKGSNGFRFDVPSRYRPEDAAFFAAWDALHAQEDNT